MTEKRKKEEINNDHFATTLLFCIIYHYYLSIIDVIKFIIWSNFCKLVQNPEGSHILIDGHECNFLK